MKPNIHYQELLDKEAALQRLHINQQAKNKRNLYMKEHATPIKIALFTIVAVAGYLYPVALATVLIAACTYSLSKI